MVARAGLILAAAAVLSACGSAKNVPRRQKPVATTENSTISATGPVVADGVATSVIQVVIRDQNGAPMPGLTPVVSASGSGNQIHPCGVTDVNGAASCAMSSTVAEIKSINLSAPVAVAGTSVEFVAGPAVKLGFSRQPSSSTSGQSFVVQPMVDVQDAHGNRVPAATHAITLALAAGGTGSLDGVKTLNAAAGRASYAGLSVGGVATSASLRLTATAAGLTAATSEAFTVVPDGGSTLSFATQPGGGAAGAAWAAQPVVHILDSGGGLLTSATQAVTLTLTAGSGALLGTATVSAVGGVATFGGLRMEAVGAKELTATSPGSANVVSDPFTIVPAAPATLSFAVQPGGGAANQVWAQQPAVRLFDAYGNLCVNAGATVALSLQTGTGTLAGTTSLAAVSGVATFTDLRMAQAGPKSLRATAGTLYIDSGSFLITSGTAAVLKFATQPGGGTAGVAWAQQPVVEVLDDQNNRVTNFNGTVSLSLTTGSGTLAGATSLAAVSGVATYAGLKLNTAGTGKIVTAGVTGLSGVASAPFAITHNAPAQLLVRTQPSTGDLANTPLGTQPALDLKDAFGNLITTGVDQQAPVVASIYSGGGTVLGASTLAFSAGQMSFMDLRVSTPGAKVLKFTKMNTTPFGGTGELTVHSDSFNAVVGAPAQLKFVTAPTGGVAGVVWGVQPVAEIQDVAGNRVTTAAGTVAINLQSGGGTLLGAPTAVAASGVATFSNLKLNVSGAKTLRVTLGTLAADTTPSFTILHAAASQIALATQPGNGTINVALPTQPVAEIRDDFGNRVTTGPDATAFVNAGLVSGSGTLTGTASVAAVGGLVTFTGLRINQVGPKVLRFTKDDTSGSPGGTAAMSVDSNTFTVNPGAVASLAVLTAPGAATAGQVLGVQPQIELRDASGNRVTTSSATVSVTLQSGTGPILGTTSVTAASGVATFTNLQLNVTGDKVLRFTSGAFGVNAASFRVKPGIATQMIFATEIAGAVAEQAFATQPVIHLRDAQNNVVTEGPDAAANVTASLLSGTGALSGQLTLTAASGVVTYTNLGATTVGSKRVRFTKADLSGAGGAAALTLNSDTFSVEPGNGTQLAFTVQPGGGTAGVAWAQQPQVEILDANGNRDTSSTAAVTLALTTGSGALGGTATVSAVAGLATFGGLSVDAIGADKVLTASAAGMSSAVSNAFTIVPGAPVASSDIAISAGPKWSNGSDAYTVSVTVRDAHGNPVAGRTVSLATSRAAADTITGSPASSDANGEASFTVTSVTGGTSTLTATVNPGSVTLSTTVSAVFDDYQVSAAQSSWTQDRVSLAADGATLLTFTGVLRNAAGTALPGKTATLASDRGGADIVAPAGGATTDAGGAFSFTLRSGTPGVAKLSLAAPADAVTVTSAGRAQFLARTPYSEYVPALASTDAVKMIPGSNTGPVSVWRDVAAGGSADLGLLGFAYNTSSSGWMGDGNTVISGGTSGPYRLTFDGSGDGVNAGTSFDSLSAMTFEAWARPAAVTAGRTLMSNATGSRGLHLRNAVDGSGRWELRLGTAALYSEVVATDSPSAYWRLNETSGTNAAPTVGGVTGTYTASGVTYAREGAIANNDKAPAFNGSTGWIDFGNNHDGSGDLTVEAWVYLTSAVTSNPRAVVAKATTTAGYALEVNTDQNPTFTVFSFSTAHIATGATALQTNQWYHLVGVRKTSENCAGDAGRSVSIYVNGALEDCTDYTGANNTTTNALRVGDHVAYSVRRFPGRIDEVAIYVGTALAESRIAAHTNARTVPHCYSTSSIVTGAWTHLVAGFDGSTQNLRLQIDGTENCNLTTSGVTLNGGGAALGLGARINSGSVVGGSEWTGSLGDIRIYDQGINATDAATNHGAQSAKYPD